MPLDMMLLKLKKRSPPRAWTVCLISWAPRSTFLGSFGSARCARAETASSSAAQPTTVNLKIENGLTLMITIGSLVRLSGNRPDYNAARGRWEEGHSHRGFGHS